MVKENTAVTVEAVLDGTLALMRETGYSKATMTHSKTAYYAIKRLHAAAKTVDYSSAIADSFAETERLRHESGLLSKGLFYQYRRFAAFANQYSINGTLLRTNAANKNLRQANAENKALLDDFKDSVLAAKYQKSTIRSKVSSTRVFLFYVEDNVTGGLPALTQSAMSDFLTQTAKRRRPSMRLVIEDVKQFVEYLISRGLTAENLLQSLDVYAPRDRKVYLGFTKDESNRLLSEVDCSTDIGKRDYAILTLAKRTGLRGVDIRNLKLRDIFWEDKEIRLIQSKTNKPLVLPLDVRVGNAIADYILHARPNSADEHVFLRVVPPFVGFTDVGDVIERYADISGVSQETKAPIGLHSFRRAMGLSLLDSNAPLALISEILGHAKRNSTKRYIAIDIERLKLCAMPMTAFACRKEELL